MQSPACGLKFCGVRGRGAILAHAASRMTFHGYFESTFTKQYSTKFSGAMDSSLGRFLYLWSLHLIVVNIVKTMFKWIFLSLIFTPCCKYTHSKNNVKFLQLTSSELHQELLKLNRVVCCLKLLFYFGIIFSV